MSNFNVVQIGCGVVGGAYVEAYSKKNINAICVEYNETIIENLKQLGFEAYKNNTVPELQNIDFVFLSICTPFNEMIQKLDMKYLDSTVVDVSNILKGSPDALVIVRSTVNIGYTKEYQDKLTKLLGRQVDVCYQPEFLRAKTALEDATNPWSVVIGCETRSSKINNLIKLYKYFISEKNIDVLTIDEAELMKVVHNSFNAAKISYFNQVFLLCESINKKTDAQIDCNKMLKVISKTCEGLKNPMYGMTAGRGYFGSCLPKDSKEFSRLEKLHKLPIPLFKNVVEINNHIIENIDNTEYLNGDNQISYLTMKN